MQIVEGLIVRERFFASVWASRWLCGVTHYFYQLIWFVLLFFFMRQNERYPIRTWLCITDQSQAKDLIQPTALKMPNSDTEKIRVKYCQRWLK